MLKRLLPLLFALWVLSGVAFAQTQVADLKVALDTLWVLVTGVLVVFMQTGFALLTAGLTRAKNAVNVMTKSVMDFATGSIVYWAIGFGLMFGLGTDFFGTSGFFLRESGPGTFSSLSWTGVPLWAKFFFQLAFAGAAATIVCGAVAERVKFSAYLLYTVLISGIIYPVFGHWAWGGGWLQQLGFYDFAGSTVVHSVGGWAALAGAIVLGPRLGKFRADGRPSAIPGHSFTLVAAGTFILWLGWFGFNPGSTMAADAEAISRIALTTNLGGAAGAVAAMLYTWLRQRRADAIFTMNGGLAGLVAITAGCAFVSPASAVIIGAVAGLVVIFASQLVERLRIDDPVGAFALHAGCGMWGTLAVGLFAGAPYAGGANQPPLGLLFGGGSQLFLAQLTGVLAAAAFVFPASLAMFSAIKRINGLRVSAQEEMEGLDIGEHGMRAYPADLLSAGEPLEQPASAPQLVTKPVLES